MPPRIDALNENVFKEQHVDRFQATEPVAAWWRKLEDAQLTTLVEKALNNNHDVRIALANLQEARAFAGERDFDRYPTITANANAARQQFSKEGVAGAVADRVVSSYNAGFDASWELDLFGRVSQGIAATEANRDAREADLQGVYVSIAAEVARTYMELRGAQNRLDVATRNAANQQKTYELTQALLEEGEGNLLNIERARTQLELTQSEIPLREAEVNAAINRLSVLTGQKPSALHAEMREARPLPSIPASIDVGSPTDLLKRRPDVRSAERDLAFAAAQYNLSVADLYPRVSMFGSIGFSATSFADLGTGGANTYSFGPGIQWAAFNIGRVKAQIDAADARTNREFAEFEQTVLKALEEVDTSMVNFTRTEKSRVRLLEAAHSSARAAGHARERFDTGVDNFLDVLDAERTLLEAQDRLAQSETALALNLIAIYKSLGGGWELM
jgi:multidrug efflux system outer membrane protein